MVRFRLGMWGKGWGMTGGRSGPRFHLFPRGMGCLLWVALATLFVVASSVAARGVIS